MWASARQPSRRMKAAICTAMAPEFRYCWADSMRVGPSGAAAQVGVVHLHGEGDGEPVSV